MRVVALLAILAVASLLWPHGSDVRARGTRPVDTLVQDEADAALLPTPPPAVPERSSGVRAQLASREICTAQAPPIHPLYLRAYTETGEDVTRGGLTITRGSGRLTCIQDFVEAPFGSRGIELGEFDSDSSFTFLPRKASRVRVVVGGAARASHTFVGLALSHGMLHDIVLLPNGTSARDAGAVFTAWSKAIRVTTTTAPDVWRRLPVYVEVKLDGYETLEFVYELDRPLAPMVMEPMRPK